MFLTHLWKEWRDHRTLFLAQLAIVVISSGLVVWMSPHPDWKDVLGPEILAIGAVTTLLLGGDLVAGEVRRGKHGMLARLPGGLLFAFLVKLVLLIVSFVTVTTAGVITGLLVRQHVHHDAVDGLFSGPWLLPWPYFAAMFLVIAVWTLATSCWIRHSSLALPGALVLLAVVVGPFVLIKREHPVIEPQAFDLVAIPLLIGIAGLVAAFVSFTRGFRNGGASAAAVWGVPLALLLCVPAWGLGVHRLRQWTSFDPGGRGFRILSAVLGEGGRFAFVSANHSVGRWEFTPVHSLVIDLQDGSWRDLDPAGNLGGWIHETCVGTHGRQYPLGRQQSTVLYREDLSSTGGWESATHILDGVSGRVLARNGDATFDEHLRAHQRASTPLCFDGGRRAWFVHGVMEVEREDGQVASRPWDPSFSPWILLGEGFSYWTDPTRSDSVQFHDLNLGRPVEAHLSTLEYDILMRPGRWILTRRNAGRYQPELFDPITQEFEAAPFLREGDQVVRLLDDGTLLVQQHIGKGSLRQVILVDPERGSRRLISFEDGNPAVVTNLHDTYRARTPRGRPVVALGLPNGHSFARLDLTRGVLLRGPVVRDGDLGQLVACFDEDSALVIVGDERSLARIHFDGAPPETLFPR